MKLFRFYLAPLGFFIFVVILHLCHFAVIPFQVTLAISFNTSVYFHDKIWS